MPDTLLPHEFADLERFARDWCLATEQERYDKRLASTMTDMADFYDAFFPRLEDGIKYCDSFPLDELPDDAVNLLHLIYSLISVSMAIEIFKQPKAVDAADAVLTRVREPAP